MRGVRVFSSGVLGCVMGSVSQSDPSSDLQSFAFTNLLETPERRQTGVPSLSIM